MKVEVLSHDPRWRHDFEKEKSLITVALGQNLVEMYHIGSTSIPGIFAKPTIDILLEVNSFEYLETEPSPLARIGYEAMGEFGIPGRQYFRKTNAQGVRTHHVHAFESGHPGIARHLAFRDYLVAHPAEAQTYSTLKQVLANEYPNDIQSYMDGKDAFIKEIEARALTWKTGSNKSNGR
jgi:GrpB-like predicted nucleotidyltransferase (UPF0157 family)